MEEKNKKNLESDIKKDSKQETSQELPKKDKKKTIIICAISIIAIILISIGSLFIYKNYFKDKESQNNNKEQENVVNQKHELYFYKDEEGYIYLKESDYEERTVAFTIPVESADAKIYDYSINKKDPYEESSKETEVYYVLYEDNGLKLYDVKNDKTTNIDLNYDNYGLHVSYDLTEVKGIIFNKYEETTEEYPNAYNYGYYNLSTKEILYENQYDSLSSYPGEYIAGLNYLNDDETPTEHLLRSDKEESVHEVTGYCARYYDLPLYEDKYLFIASFNCTGLASFEIYTENSKLLYSGDESGFSIGEDGTIRVRNNNKIETYDFSGELLKTSKKYEKILQVFKEHIVYIKNKTIYIEDNEGVSTKLGKWEDNYYYHYVLSHYYGEEALEYDKEPGIYLVFEYGQFAEGPGVEYYYNPETREVIEYPQEYIGGYAKPVLYLYPEEETEVTINFEHEDNLTTTYPKFQDEWTVTAHPNGDLYDENGNYYYGLYWEEDSNHLVDFKEGFYVSKDNAISFLEEKLTIIGLNAKERNEFIMYWLPILEKNEHNLVYFELTEERESFNKLEITPTPDSLLRVAIHVKKIDGPQSIKEQKLTTLKRTGFTAVEWGGVSYK